MAQATAVRRGFMVAVGNGALFAVLLLGPAWTPAARADDRRTADRAALDLKALWTKGSDEVLSGEFQAAAKTLSQLRAVQANNPELDDALSWVEHANKVAASRSRLRRKAFERHATRAREHQSAEKWSDALAEIHRCSQLARDEAAFLREPWVLEIVTKAEESAAALREKGEWIDAYVLYERLRTMYRENEEYPKRSTICRQHGHFKSYYTEKEEYKAALRGVTPGAVREFLSRVANEYVREVDFKQGCILGLETLVLLARTPDLNRIFPGLGDPDLVGNFVDRVEQQISRVRRRTRFDAKEAANVFDRVLRINHETIGIPDPVLIDEFIGGFSELLDDFTSVIWPGKVDEFTKHTRGEFVGVGIQITKEKGEHIRVESPLEGTPAYEAGISPGDFITHVDGRDTKDLLVDEAVRMITGEPDTRVTLTVRSGETGDSQTYTLARRRIQIWTVRGVSRRGEGEEWDYLLDTKHRIGYIRVNSFMEKTVDELRAALERLERQDCRGLILDLRFNPGGLLRSAVDACNLFLDEDEPIVMTKGRSGKSDGETTARPGNGFRGLPLIVLVNEYSASASEIVAGALAGRGKALVIGSRTYGKGSVQNLIPIEEGAAYLKLTTQYYYIPTGDVEEPWRCLHRDEKADSKIWGVDPDIEVKLIPYETGKVLRLRRQADILRGKGKQSIPKNLLKRPTTEPADEEGDEAFDDMPDTDPQLVTALHVMRMKLVSKQPWGHGPRVVANVKSER